MSNQTFFRRPLARDPIVVIYAAWMCLMFILILGIVSGEEDSTPGDALSMMLLSAIIWSIPLVWLPGAIRYFRRQKRREKLG